MHVKSSRDICLGQEGILCVILFSEGKPEADHVSTMKALHGLYGIKQERGLQYKFMWVDATQETNWATLIKFENTPKIVVVNPGKRKRILDHEGQVTIADLKKTIEKISNGDAIFKRE